MLSSADQIRCHLEKVGDLQCRRSFLGLLHNSLMHFIFGSCCRTGSCSKGCNHQGFRNDDEESSNFYLKLNVVSTSDAIPVSLPSSMTRAPFSVTTLKWSLFCSGVQVVLMIRTGPSQKALTADGRLFVHLPLGLYAKGLFQTSAQHLLRGKREIV